MEETAKQKAIREAWGVHYEFIYDLIDENGWADNSVIQATSDGFEYNGDKCRPKSLTGIEDNKGWIRTDERLPDTFNTVTIYYTIGETGVQETAHLKPDGNFYGVDREAIDFYRLFKGLPVENKPCSFGFIGNDLYAVDYGS